MKQKKQENYPSNQELFIKFPILENAILDLLNMFVPVKDLTFQNLIMLLQSDNSIKQAYSQKINHLLKLRQRIFQASFQEFQTSEGRYKGQSLRNQPNGEGSLICENSIELQEYRGFWNRGQFSEGTLFYKNGDIFHGIFKDGKRKRGTYIFAESANHLDKSEQRVDLQQRILEKSKEIISDFIVIKFEGQWLDEQISKGILFYKNGAKYKGEIKYMKRHGQGEYFYPNIQENKQLKMHNLNPIQKYQESQIISFSGLWDDDEKVRGTIIYRDGHKYEGPLLNDLPHGKGFQKFLDGSIYEGDFQNGLRNGSGIFSWLNGSKYDGSWQQNKKHGIGQYKWASGNFFQGSFSNDVRNGIGRLWSAIGTLYQGTYQNDKLDGLAIIQNLDGHRAYAEIKNDLNEGLYAENRSDSIIWITYSENQKHGLKIMQKNEIILMEADKIRKRFNEKEVKKIIKGTLDVTQFFWNKEDSTKRLQVALNGRPFYPSQIEFEDILQRASQLREEFKTFRLKQRINDTLLFDTRWIKEVSQDFYKYRRRNPS